MDCETANDLLLDLVYDELDEVRAAAVRKHVETCAECREALRRIGRGRALARQLPAEEPPPVSAALTAAFTARASEAARVAVGGGSTRTSDAHLGGAIPIGAARRSGAGRFFDRIGELAMRRQVAMAAVFLLMIGVGLIFYQTHPRPTGTADVRTPDVVPAVEVPGAPAQPIVAGPPTTAPHRPSGVASASRPGPGVTDRDDHMRQASAPSEPRAPAPGGSAPSSDPVVAQPESERAGSRPAPLDLNTNFQVGRNRGAQNGLVRSSPETGETINAMPAVAPAPAPAAEMVAAEPPAPPPPPSAPSSASGPGFDGVALRPETNAQHHHAAVMNSTGGNSAGARPVESDRIAQLRAALARADDEATRARLANELAAALTDAGRTDEAASVRLEARGNHMNSTVTASAPAAAPVVATTAPTTSESSMRSMRRPAARPMPTTAGYPSGGPMRGRPARSAPGAAPAMMDSAY